MQTLVDPSTEPKTLAQLAQERQRAARNAMYSALNDAAKRHGYENHEARKAEPACLAAVAAYDATVTELEALLGQDAHCNLVDCDLWSLYSDCYKDDVGFRPRWHRTRTEVQAYLACPQAAFD